MINWKRNETALPKTDQDLQKELKEAKSMVHKMDASKRMVVTGFVVSLTGIAAYCYVTLCIPNDGKDLSLPSLAVVAIGFIVWLLGAIRYFNLAIDSGDSDSVF